MIAGNVAVPARVTRTEINGNACGTAIATYSCDCRTTTVLNDAIATSIAAIAGKANPGRKTGCNHACKLCHQPLDLSSVGLTNRATTPRGNACI